MARHRVIHGFRRLGRPGDLSATQSTEVRSLQLMQPQEGGASSSRLSRSPNPVFRKVIQSDRGTSLTAR